MYKENFPARIKKARLEAGYTQIQTSDITGIPQTTLSKFETGTQEPSLEQLGILAQFYNISINWLLSVSIDPPITPPKKELTR